MSDILQMDGEWPFDDGNGNSAFGRLFNKFLEIALGDLTFDLLTVEDLVAETAAIAELTGDTIEVTESVTAPEFLLEDGSDKNHQLSVYAAGTAYALTDTAALLNFGTTDPSLTLNKAGTYLILGRVNLKYNAATFADSRTVTLKLRRTNNTPADLTNGSMTALTDIITTLTYTMGVFNLQPVVYTTAVATDIIQLFGDVSVVPTAGSLDAVEASIVAIRLF